MLSPKLVTIVLEDGVNVTVQKAAMGALRNLVHYEGAKKQILAYPGAIEGLVKLMDVGNSFEFVEGLVSTLVSLASESEGATRIGEVSGVISKLVMIVLEDGGNAAVQEAAMEALRNLAQYEPNRKQTLEHPGAIEGLVKLMDVGKSIKFVEDLVSTLVSLACESEGGTRIGEISGVISKLVTIVLEGSGNVAVQEAAMKALQSLAKIEANRKQILQYLGGIEGLVKLMDVGKSIQFVEDLVNTLLSLAIESEGVARIEGVSGGISKLVMIVLDEYPGGIEGLVKLMDFGKSTQFVEDHVNKLLSLAIESEGRTIIGEVSGLSPSSSQLSSEMVKM